MSSVEVPAPRSVSPEHPLQIALCAAASMLLVTLPGCDGTPPPTAWVPPPQPAEQEEVTSPQPAPQQEEVARIATPALERPQPASESDGWHERRTKASRKSRRQATMADGNPAKSAVPVAPHVPSPPNRILQPESLSEGEPEEGTDSRLVSRRERRRAAFRRFANNLVRAVVDPNSLREVYVNGKRLSSKELVYMDGLACGQVVPDGDYWLNAQAGQWGHAGQAGQPLPDCSSPAGDAHQNSERSANSGASGGYESANVGRFTSAMNHVGTSFGSSWSDPKY